MKVNITIFAPNESIVWGQSWHEGLAHKIAMAVKDIEKAVEPLPDDCGIEVRHIPQTSAVHFDEIDGIAYGFGPARKID